MATAMETQVADAVEAAQRLNLSGAALEAEVRYRLPQVHADIVRITIAALNRGPEVKIDHIGECCIPDDVMAASGLPRNTALPIVAKDGKLVIG